MGKDGPVDGLRLAEDVLGGGTGVGVPKSGWEKKTQRPGQKRKNLETSLHVSSYAKVPGGWGALCKKTVQLANGGVAALYNHGVKGLVLGAVRGNLSLKTFGWKGLWGSTQGGVGG